MLFLSLNFSQKHYFPLFWKLRKIPFLRGMSFVACHFPPQSRCDGVIKDGEYKYEIKDKCILSWYAHHHQIIIPMPQTCMMIVTAFSFWWQYHISWWVQITIISNESVISYSREMLRYMYKLHVSLYLKCTNVCWVLDRWIMILEKEEKERARISNFLLQRFKKGVY